MNIFSFNIFRNKVTLKSDKKKVNSGSISEYVSKGMLIIGANTIYQNSKFEIRSDQVKKYIDVGSESVINGNYIIENENGKIFIGNRTFIGGGLFISINEINIGNDVMFSWGCTVMDNDAHSLEWRNRVNDVKDWKKGLEEEQNGKHKDWSNVNSAPIKICDKAWIGFNCIILKGITIGEGAVVAAGSVVTKNVAPYTLVAGNPARYIKDLPR